MKELRLENVCDMEADNAFLPGFIVALNERFALTLAAPDNLHRRVNDPGRLNDVLGQREQRHVNEQLILSYDRKQIVLERNEISEELGSKYVEVYAFPNGTVGSTRTATCFSNHVFNKDQRVSPQLLSSANA